MLTEMSVWQTPQGMLIQNSAQASPAPLYLFGRISGIAAYVIKTSPAPAPMMVDPAMMVLTVDAVAATI